MVFKKFEELLALVDPKANKKTVALVRAEDDHALGAVAEVVEKGLIDAILIGNREAIKETAAHLGVNVRDEQILDAQTPEEAATEGVKLIREGKADAASGCQQGDRPWQRQSDEPCGAHGDSFLS